LDEHFYGRQLLVQKVNCSKLATISLSSAIGASSSLEIVNHIPKREPRENRCGESCFSKTSRAEAEAEEAEAEVAAHEASSPI